MNRIIPPEAWESLAQALDVKVSALRAVALVESAGQGFLAPPDDRPKVLFEGHIFHRLTQGRFDATHPSLSFRKWTRKYYAKTQPLEWQRLETACTLDRAAALQSASWGLFQIMGFNYSLCGFTDIESFVAGQRAGAAEQLEIFTRFISRKVFLNALRALDWAAFAAAYNGPGYAQNKYDSKMAAAFKNFEGLANPAADSPKPAAIKRLAPRPPGRAAVAPVSPERKRARRLPVKPDRVDLRDWLYRPNIARAPLEFLMPHDPRAVVNQGETSACTGFALAATIEYLLDRAQRPVEQISGYMLYDMARRYDEYAGRIRKIRGRRCVARSRVGPGMAPARAVCGARSTCPAPPTTPTTGGWTPCAGRSGLLPHVAGRRVRPALRAHGRRRAVRQRADPRRLGCADVEEIQPPADHARRDSAHRVPQG